LDEHPYDPSTMAALTRSQTIVEVAVGGNLMSLKAEGLGGGSGGGGKRGKVKILSSASRRRLLRLQNSINRERCRHLPLFMTLTYPQEYPTDGKTVKRHLDTFLKRLARAYPSASAIWKLEYQERGAPHYHLMVYGSPYIGYGWVATSWYDVVGSEDKRHLVAGTQVKRIESWRQATYYVAKYIAKVDDTIPCDNPGRFWGVFNREQLPIDIVSLVITLEQFYRLRRHSRKYLAAMMKRRNDGKRVRLRGSPHGGCSLYISDAVARRLLAWGGIDE